MILSQAETEIISIIREYPLDEIAFTNMTLVLAKRRDVAIGTTEQQLNKLYRKFGITGRGAGKLIQLAEMVQDSQ